MRKTPLWLRRIAVGSISALTVAGAALVGLTAPASATSSFTLGTLAGSNRFGTAAKISEAAFPSGASSAIIATGLNFPDALAAAYLAGVNSEPILLVNPTDPIPSETLNALSTLKTKNVTIVGGTSAVGSDVQATLASTTSTASGGGTLSVSRIAGATRYDTMQDIDTASTGMVGTETINGKSGKTAFLATGNNFPDALAAGPAAYALHLPVILTDGTQSTLTPQAQSVISTDGITNLIVVGGSAAINPAQYSSFNNVVEAGSNRSATSQLLASFEVANLPGFSNTRMDVANGLDPNFNVPGYPFGFTPDALAGAPYGGDPVPTLITNSPSDPGSATAFAQSLANTLTGGEVFGGTAAVNSSTIAQIEAAGQASAPPPPSTTMYSVSPAYSSTPTALPASTSTATSQGTTTYTVSGLPTTSGTTVNIALFPLTGTAQTSNNTTDGAPTVSSSGVTFTAPGGTSPSAGTAIGQGTSQTNNNGTGAGLNGAGASEGSVSGSSATAYIASVNGVPTATNLGTNTTGGPTQVYNVTASSGSLSFVLNSFQGDNAVPVVYTAPSSAGSAPPLLVTSAGAPQSGYEVGVGNDTAWAAPPAPSTSGGYIVSVVDAPASGGSTFTGDVLQCVNSAGNVGNTGLNGGHTKCPSGVTTQNGATSGSVFTFSFGNSGSTFHYVDNSVLSQANFASYLSAGNANQTVPNSTTVQPYNGDVVDVGFNDASPASTTYAASVTGYASNAPAAFAFDATSSTAGSFGAAHAYGDVPLAPTNASGTYNGCAYTSSSTCVPGVIVTWTPSTNPDMSGTTATTTAGTAPVSAQYTVWRSLDTNGTLSAATSIGTVTVTTSSVTPGVSSGDLPGGNTPVATPELIDTSISAAAQYVYYVTATSPKSTYGQASGAAYGGNQTGAFSSGSSPVTAGAAAPAPLIKEVVITPSVAGNLVVTNGTYTLTGAVPATATITYNTPVSCLSAAGADFTYSNTGGTGAVKGTSCQDATSTSGGNPVATDQIVVTLAQVTQSGSGTTATYTQNNVVVPGNGDSFTYAVPSPQTTADAVYGGTATSPTYEAAQTVSSTGAGAASSSNPLGSGTGVPVMGSASVTVTGVASTSVVTIKYNETPVCPSTQAGVEAAFSYTNGGATATPAATGTCTVTGNSIVLTGWSVALVAPAASDTLTYQSPNATNTTYATTTAVYSASADTATGAAQDFALSPQTLSSQGSAVGPLS